VPTYQYSCTDCGHFFEVFQSFSDDSLTECPECGGTLRKVFNAVGVVFKGSGFYRTDSRTGAKERGGSNGTGGSGSDSETPAPAAAQSDSTSGGTTSSGSSGGSGSSSSTPAAASS
jgi:putative FmdB family regulatory protein